MYPTYTDVCEVINDRWIRITRARLQDIIRHGMNVTVDRCLVRLPIRNVPTSIVLEELQDGLCERRKQREQGADHA